MPSPPGRRLRAFARIFGGIAVVSLLAFLAASGSARGDSISQKKAEAARIEREIQTSQMRLEGAIQNYDHANQQLQDVRAAGHRKPAKLLIAKANLATAQAELSAFLVSSYKGQNPTASAIFVLGANSFADLVNRVEYINHTALSQQQVLQPGDRLPARGQACTRTSCASPSVRRSHWSRRLRPPRRRWSRS